jgi:gluconolactonase
MIFSSRPEKLAGNFEFLEGPVWCPPDSPAALAAGLSPGGLLFSDLARHRIHWWPDGQVGLFREPSGAANGSALDHEGRLVTCEHETRQVTRTGSNGSVEVLAASWRGCRLNSPNDVTAGRNGWLYFTDPPYGVQQEDRELSMQGVFRLGSAAGTVDLEVDDFEKPNGLALSPDEATLYVADTERGHLRAFEGAALTGVAVFGQDGAAVETLELPERPANLAFGEDGRTLFICARTSLYKVRTVEPGQRLLA